MIDSKELLRSLNIEQFYENEGLQIIDTNGDDKKSFCAFHHDTKTPNLRVNVVTGEWYCHACAEGGSLFDFYMKKHGVEFKTSVEEIAAKEGRTHLDTPNTPLPPRREDRAPKRAKKPNPVDPIPESVVTKYHDALINSDKPLKFLQEKRGLTIDTIKEFELGFDGERVTIPVYDSEGICVNVRRYKPKDEYKFLPYEKGYGSVRLFGLDALSKDEIVLVEGEMDCILGRQHGINTITHTGGAGKLESVHDWRTLFAGKVVFLCYDNDEAGRKAAHDEAELIDEVADEVRIVELPVPNEKDDLTDWIMSYGGAKDKWEELVDIAPRYEKPAEAPTESAAEPPKPEANQESIEDAIYGLPQEIDFQEHQAALDRIFEMVAKMPPFAREHYVQLIKSRWKFGVTQIREAIKQKETAMKMEPAIPRPLDEPMKTSTSLAQDMVDDVFHYGVWVSTSTTGNYMFRLVTSERELIDPIESEELEFPDNFARWSLDGKTPHNLFAFLNNKADVDASELFHELVSFFKRFMWYSDERVYKLLAAWVMETYVFMIFDQVGYLALVGTKRAGKTRLFELFEMLAFNAQLSTSVSDAYVFRGVEQDRLTLLVDEADSLQKSPKESMNERLEILRSGYKRSGSVGRIEGEDRQRVRFSTYSMKAIANVSGLEEALEDRTIPIPVERKPEDEKVERLIVRRVKPEVQLIRNKLYCFGLQNAKKIADMYVDFDVQGIEDREVEIWTGLMCIARLIDPAIADDFLEMAIENGKRKDLREGSESVEAQVLLAVWTVAVDEKESAHIDEEGNLWFLGSLLRDACMDQLEWKSFSSQRLGTELTKMKVIENSNEFKQRFRLDVPDGLGGTKEKRVVCYRIDTDRIEAAADKYKVKLRANNEEQTGPEEDPFG